MSAFLSRRCWWAVIAVSSLTLIGNAAVPHGARRDFPAVSNDDVVEGLLSTNITIRTQTYKLWGEARMQQVDDLVALLNQKPDRLGLFSTRELAATMLGALREPKACRALIDEIECKSGTMNVEDSPLNAYPCALALRNIGLNAVPEILWYLRRATPKTVSDNAIDLFARVLDEIYGFETSANGGYTEADGAVDRFTARTPDHLRVNFRRLRERMKALHALLERRK